MLRTLDVDMCVTVTVQFAGRRRRSVRSPSALTASAPADINIGAGQHMGILSRLFGGGDKAMVAPAPTSSPKSVTPAGQPVRLRLSRRGTPWVRDDLFGDGKWT